MKTHEKEQKKKIQEECLNFLRDMGYIEDDTTFEIEDDLEYLDEEVLNYLKEGNYKTLGGVGRGEDLYILFPDDTLIDKIGETNYMYFYDNLRELILSFPSAYMEDSTEETIEKFKKEFED